MHEGVVCEVDMNWMCHHGDVDGGEMRMRMIRVTEYLIHMKSGNMKW